MGTKYFFDVRDAGTPVPSLTPTFSVLRAVDGTDLLSLATTIAPITAMGGGLYVVEYDPTGQYGEIAGIIDAGNTITADADRYITMPMASDSYKIATILSLLGTLNISSLCDRSHRKIGNVPLVEDFVFVIGNTFSFTVGWYDANDDPIDLSSDTLTFILTDDVGNTITGDVTVGGTDNNQTILGIDADVTEDMTDFYTYELKRVESGNIVRTLMVGSLEKFVR